MDCVYVHCSIWWNENQKSSWLKMHVYFSVKHTHFVSNTFCHSPPPSPTQPRCRGGLRFIGVLGLGWTPHPMAQSPPPTCALLCSHGLCPRLAQQEQWSEWDMLPSRPGLGAVAARRSALEPVPGVWSHCLPGTCGTCRALGMAPCPVAAQSGCSRCPANSTQQPWPTVLCMPGH